MAVDTLRGEEGEPKMVLESFRIGVPGEGARRVPKEKEKTGQGPEGKSPKIPADFEERIRRLGKRMGYFGCVLEKEACSRCLTWLG